MQWLMQDFFHCLKIARLRKFSWTPKKLYFISDWSSHFKSFTLKSKFLFYYYSQFSSTSSNALSGLFLHIPTKMCHKNFFLRDSLFIKLMFLGLRVFENSWAQKNCCLTRGTTLWRVYFAAFSQHVESAIYYSVAKALEICLWKFTSVYYPQRKCVRPKNNSIFLVKIRLIHMCCQCYNYQRPMLQRHLSSRNGSTGTG